MPRTGPKTTCTYDTFRRGEPLDESTILVGGLQICEVTVVEESGSGIWDGCPEVMEAMLKAADPPLVVWSEKHGIQLLVSGVPHEVHVHPQVSFLPLLQGGAALPTAYMTQPTASATLAAHAKRTMEAWDEVSAAELRRLHEGLFFAGDSIGTNKERAPWYFPMFNMSYLFEMSCETPQRRALDPLWRRLPKGQSTDIKVKAEKGGLPHSAAEEKTAKKGLPPSAAEESMGYVKRLRSSETNSTRDAKSTAAAPAAMAKRPTKRNRRNKTNNTKGVEDLNAIDDDDLDSLASGLVHSVASADAVEAKEAWTQHTNWAARQVTREIESFQQIIDLASEGELTAPELELRLSQANKAAEDFISKLGHWGSGTDPFGRASCAGKKKLQEMNNKRIAAGTAVLKAKDAPVPQRKQVASKATTAGRKVLAATAPPPKKPRGPLPDAAQTGADPKKLLAAIGDGVKDIFKQIADERKAAIAPTPPADDRCETTASASAGPSMATISLSAANPDAEPQTLGDVILQTQVGVRTLFPPLFFHTPPQIFPPRSPMGPFK